MSSPDPTQLASALRKLEPRLRQVLTWRFVQDVPEERCASLLGIPEQALRIHLVRALRALDAELSFRPPELTSDEEEARLSGLLGKEGTELTDGTTRRLAALSAALRSQGAAILREQKAAELAAEQSPARAREDLLRRLAIVALIALAAFFYWRNEVAEAPSPRTPARDVRPR